ncbi:MAG: DUF4437 domain-containing protein [Planctomycetota bacterium]
MPPIRDHVVSSEDASAQVTPIEEVRWSPLNPARGDAGPRAADLWGDRSTASATGFLVRFADGFSSPPHIHNVTYRGVVIDGLIHNDDPGAEPMWMPTGSYWTQPAGEVHITSAKGEGRLAYIEIESGPYLVRPSEEASDNGERALNVHAANIVWMNAATTRQIETPTATEIELARLWGSTDTNELNGSFVRLGEGTTVYLDSPDARLIVVVVRGEATLHGIEDARRLEPGSVVDAAQDRGAPLKWSTDTGTTLYVRTSGMLTLRDAPG